jgi:alpha-tubulin suppressor-like RCC1 family protein
VVPARTLRSLLLLALLVAALTAPAAAALPSTAVHAPHVQLPTVRLSGEPSPQPPSPEAPEAEPPAAVTPQTRAAEASPATAGAAAAWGENYFAQLGTFYKDTWEPSPVGVEGLTDISELAVASTFNLALLSDGTVAAWGGNGSGQLGDDRRKPNWEEGLSHTFVQEEDPATHQVRGELHGVKAVAAANEHSLALMANGTVMAWGNDQYGQLGSGRQGFERILNINERLPKPVPGLSAIKAIAEGGGSDYAVTATGTVRAWGSNTSGQLGLGEPGPDHCETGVRHYPAYELCSEVPRPVMWRNPSTGRQEELGDVASVRAGRFAAYALLEDGHVVSWGSNHQGELGTGAETWTATDYPPAEVRRANGQPLTGVVEVAAGFDSAMARLSNGEVLGWGSAAQGGLAGVPSQDCRRNPSRKESQEATGTKLISEPRPCVKLATNVPAVERLQPTQLSVGHDYGLALSAGMVYSWGSNEYGQLGSGKTAWGRSHPKGGPATHDPGDPVPKKLKGLGPVTALAAGGTHADVLLAPGAAPPAPLIAAEPETLALNLAWRGPEVGAQGLLAERLIYRVAEREGEPEPAEQGRSETEEGPPSNLESEPPHVTLGGEPTETRVLVPGEQLLGEPGGWSGARPIGFAYQWQRCDASGESCANIAGAKRSRYRIANADIGSTLRVLVTATGPEGLPSTVASPATLTPIGTGEEGEAARAAGTSIHLSGLADRFQIDHVIEKVTSSHGRPQELSQPLRPISYEVRFRASKRSRLMILTPLP